MPCYGNIPEGDEVVTHWEAEERVIIINFLDDIGEPFSCNNWGTAGVADIPIIIDDGEGHTFHDLFDLQLDAYPVNIFLDHNMNVINITEADMNQTAVNDIIQIMLDEIPPAIDYLDDIQPIFDANCTTCHGSLAGLNLTSYANLMNGSNDGDVITPLNHSTSVLWQEINLGSMPPGSNDNLSSSQINLIAQWIDAGACESSNNQPDQCGTCDDDSSNDCVQDCNGDWGGTIEEDECGVCGGNNSTCMDCAEIPNGDSLLDECGVCDNDFSNDCIQDCNGDWGGLALFDDCTVPVCSGGETGLNPNADQDDCGVCNGENADKDCLGNCFGSAEIAYERGIKKSKGKYLNLHGDESF